MEQLDSVLLQFLSDNGITVQAVLDRAAARFNPVWYPTLFRVAPASVSLDFTTIIGRSRVEAMASVVSRESQFPLRGRPGMEKLQGEVPAIGVTRSMTAKMFRELAIIRQTPGLTDEQRINAIIDNIFEDYLYVVNAVNKRVDSMCLQGLSTANITINSENNPDGIEFDVPLLLDPSHALNPDKAWSAADADIISSVEDTVLQAQDDGNPIDRIMISRALWRIISKNKSITDYVKNYNNPGSNNKYVATMDAVNQSLLDNQLPPFQIVDQLTAVEKDGINSPFRSWKQNNAVFVPAGQLGIIHNSLADEQITPVPTVQYATVGNVLTSRWYQRKPVTEFTSGEWNAFPGLEAIDSIYIMETDVPA